MDKTQTMNVAYWSCRFIAIVLSWSSICSYDYEIMQLPDTEGMPCVYQTSQQALQEMWLIS